MKGLERIQFHGTPKIGWVYVNEDTKLLTQYYTENGEKWGNLCKNDYKRINNWMGRNVDKSGFAELIKKFAYVAAIATEFAGVEEDVLLDAIVSRGSLTEGLGSGYFSREQFNSSRVILPSAVKFGSDKFVNYVVDLKKEYRNSMNPV